MSGETTLFLVLGRNADTNYVAASVRHYGLVSAARWADWEQTLLWPPYAPRVNSWSNSLLEQLVILAPVLR